MSAGEASEQEPAKIGRWTRVGSMHVTREYAGGVRLLDGRVLAVSGHPLGGKSIASAELYDPKTREWMETGSLREARNSGNRATLLLDGRVLLAGGHSNSEVIAGAELFDPNTGRWSDAGRLRIPRDPMAVLLIDGRVLVAGGINWYVDSGRMYSECELFDPNTGIWSDTGSHAKPRNEHRMLCLDDGRVLAVGGYGQGEVILASTELYDPRTGRWSPTGELPQPRAWFGLVKLLDGRVLTVGGYTGERDQRTYLSSSVIYDPASGRWTESSPMQVARGGFALSVTGDGRVLVCGGVDAHGAELKSAELFDPGTETWQEVTPMNVARRNHNATLLADGSVLVIGGSSFFGATYLRSAEALEY